MAFADNVQGVESLAGIFVVRILGLPYLFSHVELPSQWDNGSSQVSIDSEDYDWSTSLILEESIGSTSSQIEPKAGTVRNGSMKMTFATAGTQRDPTGDIWLDLLCNNPRRGDGLITTVTDNLNGAVKTISVTSNPWSASSGQTLYIGGETVTKTNNGTSTSFSVTRARFGSWARPHQATTYDPGVATNAIGLTVSDFPRDLNGRLVEVYFCPGEWVEGGALRLYGDGPTSAENKVIFIGPVSDVSEGGDALNRHVISAISMDSLLDAPACSRFPRATPFSADILEFQKSIRRVYLGNHNKWAHFLISFAGAFTGATIWIQDYTALTDGDTITIGPDTWTFRNSPTDLTTEFQISSTSNDDQAEQIWFSLLLFSNDGNARDWYLSPSPVGPFVVIKKLLSVSASVSFSASLSDTSALVLSGSTLDSGVQRSNLELLNLDLTDATGGLIENSWVSKNDVVEAITNHLEAALSSTFELRFTLGQAFELDPATGDLIQTDTKYSATLTLLPGELIDQLGGVDFTVIPSVQRNESILKEFGFIEPVTGSIPADETGPVVTVTAKKNPARFRWPAPSFITPDRLHLKDFPSDQVKDDFTLSQGWTDDDGSTLPYVVKIGDHEVITASTSGTSSGIDFLGGTLLRGQYNSGADEELYVEAKEDGKDKRVSATRLPGFEGCSVERMFLYLLQGGRGSAEEYDEGWTGFGLGFPEALINVSSFTQYVGLSVRDNWCIQPGDKIRDVIADECLLTQRFLTVEDGQFRMFDLLPVSQLDAEDATLTLDHSTLDTSRTGFDRKTVRIANVCTAKLNFNNATERFETEATSQQTDSVANYGPRQPVPLEVRGIADARGGADELTVATREIYGQHADPTCIIEVDVASFDLWASSIGDVVLLTHDALPKPDQAGRGVTGLACRVHALAHNWIPSDGDPHTRVTLLTDAYRARRSSIWAPSMLLLATSDGGTTWTVDDDAFGAGDPKDVEYFLEGQRVYVCERDNLSVANAELRDIDTITLSGTADASTVALSAAYTGDTADVVVWFADHDNASVTDRQKAHVYMSNGDGKLDATDEEDAYTYV